MSLATSSFAPFEHIEDIKNGEGKWLAKELGVMYEIQFEKMTTKKGMFTPEKLEKLTVEQFN